MIYTVVEKAGNKGIWMRDIRAQTNLQQTVSQRTMLRMMMIMMMRRRMMMMVVVVMLIIFQLWLLKEARPY
jgi:hypothetical protein